MGATIRILINMLIPKRYKKRKNIIEVANELFGEMRDMTPEESKAHSEYISSISKPTGINIWDLINDVEEDIDFIQPKKRIPVKLHIIDIKKHQIK